MTEIARIVKHPSDRECVVVQVPATLNEQFGRFGPARLSVEHHGYVLHHTHVDALYRFAKTVDLHLTDDRVSARRGPQVQPTECRTCAQPGERFNPPNVCPSCGAPWSPITPPVHESSITETPCPSCKHRQPGRFPYCSRCGKPMGHKPVAVVQRLALPPAPERPHLDDPLPLGDVVAASPLTGQEAEHRKAIGRSYATEISDQDSEPEQQDPEPYDPTADDADPWGSWGSPTP